MYHSTWVILLFSDCKYLDEVFLLSRFCFYMFCVCIIPVCHIVFLSCQQYCTVRQFDPCVKNWIVFCSFMHHAGMSISKPQSHIYFSTFALYKCEVSCMNNCSQLTSDTAHPVILTFSILILDRFFVNMNVTCILHWRNTTHITSTHLIDTCIGTKVYQVNVEICINALTRSLWKLVLQIICFK